jgi:hypothetical protein
MDIQKELRYTINGSEVGFFGIVLQHDSALNRVVPTFVTLLDPEHQDFKLLVVQSLLRYAQNLINDVDRALKNMPSGE